MARTATPPPPHAPTPTRTFAQAAQALVFNDVSSASNASGSKIHGQEDGGDNPDSRGHGGDLDNFGGIIGGEGKSTTSDAVDPQNHGGDVPGPQERGGDIATAGIPEEIVALGNDVDEAFARAAAEAIEADKASHGTPPNTQPHSTVSSSNSTPDREEELLRFEAVIASATTQIATLQQETARLQAECARLKNIHEESQTIMARAYTVKEVQATAEYFATEQIKKSFEGRFSALADSTKLLLLKNFRTEAQSSIKGDLRQAKFDLERHSKEIFTGHAAEIKRVGTETKQDMEAHALRASAIFDAEKVASSLTADLNKTYDTFASALSGRSRDCIANLTNLYNQQSSEFRDEALAHTTALQEEAAVITKAI